MTNANQSSVFQAIKQLLKTPDLANLGPRRRPGALSIEQLNEQINRLLDKTGLSGPTLDLVRGIVLLWHDHLDAAHTLAQDIEDADGSLLHAIMHRREPDYGNSKYWFRRVGKHSCYPMIALRAGARLGQAHKKHSCKIIPGGVWDPFAFVDACEEAAKNPSRDSERSLLQEIQRIEFEALLDHRLGHIAR